MNIVKTLLFIIKLALITILITTKANALYPAKENIKKAFDLASLYIGAQLGNSISGTFGVGNTEFKYSSLYVPTRFLQGGRFNGVVGIRLADILRIEAEYSHTFQLYEIIEDPKITGNNAGYADLKNLRYSHEKLTEALAINAAIDLRIFSRSLYPHIGLGSGTGKLDIFYVDTKMLPNGGYGDKFCLDSSSNIESCATKLNMRFMQYFGGITYEMTLYPVAFTLEYRATYGSKKVSVYPKNDGHVPTADEVKDKAYKYAVGKPVKILYKNYAIIIGLRYSF